MTTAKVRRQESLAIEGCKVPCTLTSAWIEADVLRQQPRREEMVVQDELSDITPVVRGHWR